MQASKGERAGSHATQPKSKSAGVQGEELDGHGNEWQGHASLHLIVFLTKAGSSRHYLVVYLRVMIQACCRATSQAHKQMTD